MSESNVLQKIIIYKDSIHNGAPRHKSVTFSAYFASPVFFVFSYLQNMIKDD